MNEEKAILSKDNFIHNSIKDAFLQLLLKKDYMQITITDLCKYAGVSRGTFYTHFGNIGQVVEEVFSDALYDIKNMALLSENGSSSNIIVRKGLCWLLNCSPSSRQLKKYKFFLPAEIYLLAVFMQLASKFHVFPLVLKFQDSFANVCCCSNLYNLRSFLREYFYQ